MDPIDSNPETYDAVRRIAHRRLRSMPPGFTFDTGDLAGAAYLKLWTSPDVSWRDEEHFLALAARAVHQVLIDRIKSSARRAQKGGQVSLDSITLNDPSRELLAIGGLLEELYSASRRVAGAVALRTHGFTVDESAAALRVSRATVERDYRVGIALLQRRLLGSETSAGPDHD